MTSDIGWLARSRAALTAPGRIWALGVLGVLLLVRYVDPLPVETMRLRGFDLLQRLAPSAYQELKVRIVAVDEASLERFGQWPWPRALMARLIERIAEAGARVLSIDMLFVEQDRFSPARIAESLAGLPPDLAEAVAKLPSGDVALAAALKKLPVVLGFGISDDADPATHGPMRTTPVSVTGEDPRQFLTSRGAVVASLPSLRVSERGRGALVGGIDRDGIVRRVPLFVKAEDKILPSFAAETLRVAYGGNLQIVANRFGIEAVSIGGYRPPVDSEGRVYPHFAPAYEPRYIPAGALLAGIADPAALQGAIVFLGITGLGLVDFKQVPLGQTYGIDVHAQLIESMLTGRLLDRTMPVAAADFLVVLLAGLASLALSYGRPRLAGTALAGLVGLLLGGEFLAFRLAGVLLDGVYPSLCAVAGFGVMLAANQRATEAERRRLTAELQHERELKARLEGELNTARAIQMGLLPRRFPGPPERGDVETFALIEPARSVGGDLYDLMLLDERRLFFMIADVSGKGVPAALFMAMCKEVLRSAAFLHAEALDLAFAEANAKIAAASADIMGEGASMMFVTVCAGVLDLATGALVHASAGHDPPFALRPGAPPVALTSAGGPPLGAVDDFPFSVEQYQLVPGERLVLYTDGVTEAENPARAFYTTARLEQVLRDLTGDARVTVETVRENVRTFVAEAEPADDITLLALRWIGA